MGIRSKLTNNITNKVGNSLLNIEEIKEKGDLPTTQEELRQRRERAETLVKKKSLLSSGASIVPIPGLDFGVDLKLMRDIIEDVNLSLIHISEPTRLMCLSRMPSSA